MSERLLRISEIFGPTIQGEGALIGTPTVFVRAGGCDYRCSWCDTPYAVDSAFRETWKPQSTEAVFAEIVRLSGDKPLTVTLSGGNPAIQDFGPLIARGHAAGYHFACETQGSIVAKWFADLDTLVLSPKPPSSGEVVDWTAFDACLKQAGHGPDTVMKIVIFDEADYQWARDAAARYQDMPLFLQSGNEDIDPDRPADMEALTRRLTWLVERVTADGWFAARVLPQLHVMIWGNERGV